MSISRSRLRDLSFQLVYQYDFHPEEERPEQIRLFTEEQENLEEEDRAFLSDRAEKIYALIPELDQEIGSNTSGWKLNRMSRVDLAVIRLALYEMRYDDQVPVKVAINEAVELAKLYGGDSSPQFVNGVLAKLVKETDE